MLLLTTVGKASLSFCIYMYNIIELTLICLWFWLDLQSNNNTVKEALTVNISLVVYEYKLTFKQESPAQSKNKHLSNSWGSLDWLSY
jgi:hypothetical protein